MKLESLNKIHMCTHKGPLKKNISLTTFRFLRIFEFKDRITVTNLKNELGLIPLNCLGKIQKYLHSLIILLQLEPINFGN